MNINERGDAILKNNEMQQSINMTISTPKIELCL